MTAFWQSPLWTDFSKAAAPLVSAALLAMLGMGLNWLKQHFAELTETKAINETVAAVDQTMPDADGATKNAVVKKALAADPRVKSFTDPQIEQAVRMLPPKVAQPCPPAEGSGG